MIEEFRDLLEEAIKDNCDPAVNFKIKEDGLNMIVEFNKNRYSRKIFKVKFTKENQYISDKLYYDFIVKQECGDLCVTDYFYILDIVNRVYLRFTELVNIKYRNQDILTKD